VIVFAISDKGGTGRSVTSANVAFRKALQGSDVAYLDFDFGSPTAGAVFGMSKLERGVASGGMHSYVLGEVPEPVALDVWEGSDRRSMKETAVGAGKLVLFPGDMDRGEFRQLTDEMVRRCITLLLRMEASFEVTFVDLSAGRSIAADLVLTATAHDHLRAVSAKWLIFHKWTKQHLVAAAGLRDGILSFGAAREHDRAELADALRFVRTAVADPDTEAGLRKTQVKWLREVDVELNALAARLKLGNSTLFASVPLDPLLQWQEQLITDFDTGTRDVANQATVDAFESIAQRLDDPDAWAGF